MSQLRNFKYNRFGGVDCEILLGFVEAIPARAAVYSEPAIDENGDEVPITILSPAIDEVPEVPGEWHPTTLEHIPEHVVIAPYNSANEVKVLVDEVDSVQAIAALKHFGHLTEVLSIMSQLAPDDLTRVAFERSPKVRRDSPTTLKLAHLLGLNDEALTALFDYAKDVKF